MGNDNFNELAKMVMQSNARLAIKSLLQQGGDIDESYFRPEDLNELRQAIFNREWDLKYRDLYSKDNRKRQISYENYTPLQIEGRKVGLAPDLTNDMATRVNNYKSNRHSYNMQTSIGSGDYTISPTGQVTLTDTYNVNKGVNMNDWATNIPHTLVKLFGKPYKINIDLGNINDWGSNYNYTGNIGYRY